MCVCVCVCVCLYSFTVKASSVSKGVWDIIEGMDQQSCVVSINVGASVKFIHLPLLKCHILPPKTKLQYAGKWRENDMIYCSEKNKRKVEAQVTSLKSYVKCEI